MEVLRECWDSNPDGAGLMFSEKEALTIRRGFMKWRSLKRYMKRAGTDRLDALPVVFHFRIATHGSVSKKNCHPFQINENLAMAHNGVMRNIDIPKGKDISDSEAFAERFVKEAFSSIEIDSLQDGQPINELFSSHIGNGNRLLFMDNNGEIAIVNEAEGTWPKTGLGKNMWFSNMNWKPVVLSGGWTSVGRSGGSVATNAKPGTKTHIAWENGKRITKTYDKNGKLLMTSINPSSITHAQSEVDYQGETPINGNALKLSGGWQDYDGDEDWYCYDCHNYFKLKNAMRTYWTNGLTERIADCALCGSSGTFNKAAVIEDFMCCYDCEARFFWDEMNESYTEESSGEVVSLCPICKSPRTYEEVEQSLVDRYGIGYFDLPSTEGGMDASE
jgi:hypothetical protein